MNTEVLKETYLVPVGRTTSPLSSSAGAGSSIRSGCFGSPVRAGRDLIGPIVGDLVLDTGRLDGAGGGQSWLGFVGPVGVQVIATPLFLTDLASSSSLSGSLGLSQVFLSLLFLLFGLFGIAIAEQIGHDVPWQFTRNGSTETQNLTGHEPPHQTDGLVTLVVAGDADVDEPDGAVDVAKSNYGDVGVAGLGDGLVIGTRVSNNQETRLTESSLDLISKRT